MSTPAMSDLRVEKRRVHASLTLTTGACVSGCFFVVRTTAHGGPERVGDLLNADGGFFPFLRDDGATLQYNRAHVVLVRLPPREPELELEPGHAVATRRTVEMTLSTGAPIRGAVFVDLPTGRDRLSDYVRRWRQFLYVATPDDTLLVNAAHIVDAVETSAA